MEEHKQQLAPKPALEPVSDFVELEGINKDTEDDKEEEAPIKEKEKEKTKEEEKENETQINKIKFETIINEIKK